MVSGYQADGQGLRAAGGFEAVGKAQGGLHGGAGALEQILERRPLGQHDVAHGCKSFRGAGADLSQQHLGRSGGGSEAGHGYAICLPTTEWQRECGGLWTRAGAFDGLGCEWKTHRWSQRPRGGVSSALLERHDAHRATEGHAGAEA